MLFIFLFITTLPVKKRGNVTKWLWGQGNVLDSIKTEFYVIAPKNGTKVPFFERFWNLIVPEEISKRTPPLGYAFADFSRKRKVSASVGGTSPRNEKIDETLVIGRSRKILHSTSNQSFSKPSLCGAPRSTPRYLSFHEERYERRV